MGMFDYLRCEMPLPEKEGVPCPPAGTVFQTKDTDAQYLEYYTITADGRLVHHEVNYESVPEEERPYKDRGGFMKYFGSIRTVPTGDVEIPLHGDIEFHEYSDLGDETHWWSYTARFTEGRVSRIWLNEYECEPKEKLK